MLPVFKCIKEWQHPIKHLIVLKMQLHIYKCFCSSQSFFCAPAVSSDTVESRDVNCLPCPHECCGGSKCVVTDLFTSLTSISKQGTARYKGEWHSEGKIPLQMFPAVCA